MNKGDWGDINWTEVLAMTAVSAGIGIVRALYLIRRGRQFRWFDIGLEPCLAVIGGMLMWAITITAPVPDVIHAVFTSLGAWGGPRTIHWLERKYLGGSRSTDMKPTAPGDLI